MKVKVLSGQSLSDIAIQVYGNVQRVMELALENGVSVTDELESGQLLSYSAERVMDKGIARYYEVRRIRPATMYVGGDTMGIFDGSFDITFE